MGRVFGLLCVCVCLAYIYESGSRKRILSRTNGKQKCYYKEYKGTISSIFFALLYLIMVCFSGLRTSVNDTSVYISNYIHRVPVGLKHVREIDMTLGHNPGFNLYEIILKTFISENAQVFIFITASIVVGSYLLFLKKFCVKFSFVVFLLISTTAYAFTMAAIKQTLAMAIAIWALPLALEKKWFRFLLVIAVAVTIHPYVFVFLCIPFLMNRVWEHKVVIVIVTVVFAGIFFEKFVSALLGMTDMLGDEYDTLLKNEGGLSLVRLLTYMVVPLLSFVYRKKINTQGNSVTVACVNISVVSMCFMLLGYRGAGNMFGRMANYFDVFNCLALDHVINAGIGNKENRNILVIVCILCYLFFYYTYYSKYGLGLWDDFYYHVKFRSLFL